MVKTSRFEETYHLRINCLNILQYYVGRWGYMLLKDRQKKKKKKVRVLIVDTKQRYMSNY